MENKKNEKYETILLERIEKNIGLLAEGQSAIREKVDSLEVKVDSLIEDMDYVKSTLTENKDRFKEVDEVITNHEKRLIKLEKMSLAKA